MELGTVDMRFAARGSAGPPKDVVVVAVDDVTFDELHRRLQEWPRTFHARVLRAIARAGPKAVIYDFQFTEPSRKLREDLALYDAAGAARPVIFGTTEVDEHGGTGVFGSDAKTSAENLRHIGAHAGQTLMHGNAGDTIRRMGYSVNGLRSLGVVAAETVAGHPIPAPSGPTGVEWIDYAGPPGTIDTISFSRVYNGRVSPDRLHGKVVVVGPSAQSLGDVHATSAGGGQMSGAEIQANAFETARRHFPLRSAGGAVNVLLVVLMGFLAPLLTLRMSVLRVLPIVPAAAIAFLVVAQLAFKAGVIVHVVAPLLALALAAVGALAVEYLTETRDRRRLRATFARFVPEAHVEQVVDRGETRLGGAKVMCTMLFCDLREFSRFTETLQPDAFIALLNEYLREMSEAIDAHDGTVVAYQGDGIVAVFGAPIELEDHTDRALAAAREMLAVRLPSFNAWVRDQCATGGFEGLSEELMAHVFEMGIGVSSGLVVSGNVGSDRRMEYAAAGDPTNTACRLEQMTKGTGHQLFIADSTRSMLKHGWPGLVQFGNVDIRGRNAQTMVWVPVADWFELAPAGQV